MPRMPRSRLWKLALVGTAAGAFSALFGVGGGIVIVPALVMWLGYEEREAAGTSLAAIAVIAVFAVVGQGAYGNVRPLDAAIVGLPAVVGVLAGTALQQRISARAFNLAFAALLVGIAIMLVVR